MGRDVEVTLSVEFCPQKCDALDDESYEEVDVIFTFSYTPGCPGDRWTPADPGDMELTSVETAETWVSLTTRDVVAHYTDVLHPFAALKLPLSLHMGIIGAIDDAEMEAWESATDDYDPREDEYERY